MRGSKHTSGKAYDEIDLYLIRLVLDDLEDIAADTCANATVRQLRRASAPLRRLLIDNGGGLLKKAWSQIFSQGPSLKIEASRLERGRCIGNGLAVVLEANLPEGRLFQTKVAYEPNAFLSNACVVERMNLPTFLKSHVLYSPNVLLSRGQFIKYVANKAGGVHLDESLEEHELQMLEIAETYSFMGGINAIDLAMKSIGQTLSNDAMIGQWVAAAKTLI